MIEIGAKLTVEKTVTPELTAQVAGSGLLPVFGTPFMTAMMENAAAGVLQQYLEEGKGSVGTHLNVSHDAPTPVGMKVWAEAEITAVSENGKMIDFAVKAWDEKGPIGAGTHTRAIIPMTASSASATASWINKQIKKISPVFLVDTGLVFY